MIWYLKVPAVENLIALNLTCPSLLFFAVSTTLPSGSINWKMNSSPFNVPPFSCFVTSNSTLEGRAPDPIPSVVVRGAKPSTSYTPSDVVTFTLLNAFLVVLSTGAVKRVRYKTYRPCVLKSPLPFGVIVKEFVPVTFTCEASSLGRASALFHSVK